MNGDRRVEIRRRAYGYCVEGPGFYVWDEDPREVTRVGRDLARRVGCETATAGLAREGWSHGGP